MQVTDILLDQLHVRPELLHICVALTPFAGAVISDWQILSRRGKTKRCACNTRPNVEAIRYPE